MSRNQKVYLVHWTRTLHGISEVHATNEERAYQMAFDGHASKLVITNPNEGWELQSVEPFVGLN